jgi:hypothetical protein
VGGDRVAFAESGTDAVLSSALSDLAGAAGLTAVTHWWLGGS